MSGQGAHHLSTDDPPKSEEELDSLPVYKIGESSSAPIKVPLTINRKPHELDTGAAIIIISEAKSKALLPKVKLKQSLEVIGSTGRNLNPSPVRESKERADPHCCGWRWPKLTWKKLATASHAQLERDKAVRNYAMGSLEYLLDKYDEVFTEELGTIKSFSAKLNVQPKFFKPRTVPYAVRTSIEEE